MSFRGKMAVFLSLFLCLIGICGCGSKQPVTVSEFNEIMEEKGFSVSDVTDHVKADYVEAISLAVADDYQIEFYVFSDKDSAASVMEQNRSVFEENEGNAATQITKNLSNYSFFSLQSEGMYRMVSRIDNTLLYAVVDKSYKDEIVEIIKELGY